MSDVIAIGEVLIDFVALDKDEFGYPVLKGNPGGAPANFLAPISKFGLSSTIIAKVGDDAFGNLLIKTLKENRISTDAVIADKDVFTTLAFVTLDDKGDRSFSFARKPGADTMIRFDEVDLKIFDSAKVFHFGTLSLTDNPAKETTEKLVDYALSCGLTVSFDPNLRIPLWKDLGLARKAMLYGLSKANIVKISDEEVKFLFDVDIKDATSFILSKYPNIKLLYVTCGSDGAYYATSKYNGFVKAMNNINVVDTTGAGDIFGGSAMFKYLSLNKKPDELNNSELLKIVEFATVSAGLSTTKLGGLNSVPEINEIEKYFTY